MVRTSTEAQQTEDQRNEMIAFCEREGYARDQQIIIEDAGASAIKMNEKYMAMIDEMKSRIAADPDIDCVAFWALDRAWRTEKVYVDIKEFLVARRVQMIIKNPMLRLLNDDGTVNAGMEIAISLMTVLAQQEMQTKQERFKRAKAAMARQGKCVGGRTKKFGYYVDENKYFQPDEGGTADTVRLIFQLYATGNHSCETIEKELAERGAKRADGRTRIDAMFINKVLRSTAYTGRPDPKNHDRVYPQIISDELFEKCAEIRDSNKLMMRRKGDYVLGSKLIKCPECGGTFTSSSSHYTCCRFRRYDKNNEQKCQNNLAIPKKVIDELLWRVAFTNHMEYLTNMNEEHIEEYRNEIDALSQKIDTLSSKMEGAGGKKKKIVDAYLDDLIDLEERDARLKKLSDSIEDDKRTLVELSERRDNLTSLIVSCKEELEDVAFLDALSLIDENEKDMKYKYDIIHKHISKVLGYKDRFNADYRTDSNILNAQRIEIYDNWGNVRKYIYLPYGKNKLYVWNGKEWILDVL